MDNHYRSINNPRRSFFPILYQRWQADYMLNRSFVQILIVTITTLLLTACGGGGNTPSPTSNNQTSSNQQLQSLDRVNTPIIASAYLDLLSFAKETSAIIVKGEYVASLADGLYKDTCEGGSGSFEITASNYGNQLIQKYKNCSFDIIKNGIRQRVIVDGEESVSTTHNENTPSFVTISWKNYSIKAENLPAQVFDGTFIYEGLLYYNHSAQYINVTSRIKMTATISENGQSINAENVEFIFDFPAIFDRYSNDFDFYTNTPQGLHVFSKKIIKANGNVSVGKNKASFIFNSDNTNVTFSGNTTAKAHLDTAYKGFYLKWNQLDDNSIDANTFLTETEYHTLSSNIYEKNSNIYFTRYLNDYGTPHPKNHRSTGQYEPINLSKGATTEINVQELFTSKSGALLTYEINNEKQSKDWEQIEAGRFLLKFPDSTGIEIYKLDITAIDINGNRSPIITATIRMNDNLADTDKDGILDINDPDIDNDGVENKFDSFPKDATEQYDLDGDQIGDNADSDKDNDGIENALDFYPFDNACHKKESGDGSECYLKNAKYSFTDKNQIAYFIKPVGNSDNGQMRFVRFDLNSNSYAGFSPVLTLPKGQIYVYLYNPEYHQIIVGNQLDQLYILQLDDYSFIPVRSTEHDNVYPAISDHGYFFFTVFSYDTSARWAEVYDNTGKMTDSSKEEILIDTKNTAYHDFQRSNGVPFCKFSVSINKQGKFVQTGDVNERDKDDCGSPLNISADGLYAFYEHSFPVPVYNQAQEKVIDVTGFNLHWLGNNLVYQDLYPYDLIIQNPIDQSTKRLDYDDLDGGEIKIAGRKILVVSRTAYQKTVFKIYDENLQLLYDSKNN